MSFKFNDTYIESGNILAISVGHSFQNNLHNKLLINYQGNSFEMHLAFHHNFISSPILNAKNYIWETPKIPLSRLKSVAARCISIAKAQNGKTNLLPYAFGYNAVRKFDKEGIYSQYDDGSEYGMTCSTFILTVFNSVGIDLLDWNNWEDRADDRDSFRLLLILLKRGVNQGNVSEKHYENVRNEENCPKIRPEEVFSSVYCNELPMNFSCSSSVGSYVRNYCTTLPPG